MQHNYEIGQKVEVIVDRFTDLGVVVNLNNNEGLAYNSDIFENIEIGKTYIAYIKEIRPDGKIDITFRKHGYKNFIGTTTDTIIQKMKDNSGKLSLNDKAKPDEIKKTL